MADAAHDNAHAVLGKDNVDVDLKAVRHVVIIGSGPREVAPEQAGACGARGPGANASPARQPALLLVLVSCTAAPTRRPSTPPVPT